MVDRLQYVTPHEVVISSQSLLRLSGAWGFVANSRCWTLGDYTILAQDLGVGLMMEPLKSGWSPARREFDGTPDDSLLGIVKYLAEPARSETRIQDYLTSRIHWQLVYALMEDSRFSPHMITSMVAVEAKLAGARGARSFPVRVYEPRPDRASDALILHRELQQRIYAQSPAVLTSALSATANMVGSDRRRAEVVRLVTADCGRFDVAGIELNLLRLTSTLRSDQWLLSGVLTGLLQASHPQHPDRALVQAVSIQPSRSDLPGGSISLDKTVQLAADQGFGGTVIYSPGGGSNPEAEIENLKKRFGI